MGIITIAIGYIIGSIPFAYIVTRLISGKDVRKFGSGNVGATNATRVMGLPYGLMVAGLDIFKGYIAVLLARFILPVETPYYFIILAGGGSHYRS